MPSMSPRTQQLQSAAGTGADQADQMFEQGFSEMAYNVLLSRFPDLVQDVVTFKILDTDLDKGMGVGAFVVKRNTQALYIPVIMSDNNIKPIELVYHKALNIFLPLTKAWLEEIDKTALGSLGKGIKTPETLYSDVDIRNVVVPPITGRFSYAEFVEHPEKFERHQASALLEKTASEPKTMLLSFLNAAPNCIKVAFSNVLKKNPRLLKHAARVYGVNALSAAVQPRLEKVAAKQNFGGALWIADQDTTPTEFRRIFGDRAAEAYAGVRRKGFAAKDERLNRNMAVQEQPYERFAEPTSSGVYILYGVDTAEKPALVIHDPIDIFNKKARYGTRPVVPGKQPAVDRTYPAGRPDESRYLTRRTSPEFLAVMPNGDYLQTEHLVGRDSVVDEVSGGNLHKRLFKDLAGEPRVGKGVWIRPIRSAGFQATVPVEIRSITTDGDGVRRITAASLGGFGESTVITSATHPYSQIWMPTDSDIVYLPPDFIWVPLKEKLKQGDFFTSIHDLSDCISSHLSNVGAKKVSIKNAGASQFSLNGATPVSKIGALKVLAHSCVLPVEAAEALLEKAAAERNVAVWIASPSQLAQMQLRLEKHGADDDKAPKKKKTSDSDAPPPEDPTAGMDPAMMDPSQMDPAMMGGMPPAPPPPTPVELAAMEFQQHIDTEMQKLQEKSQMLAALTQRAQEIEGGAPPTPSAQTQAMGAPPAQGLSASMPQPPPGVSAAPLPGMGGQPGMEAPMDPSMGGQPGMDPSMGGQPGMDPSMGGQPPAPPMATMGPDGLNAENAEQQINPQFLDQASQLQSDDIFDAAAVSSLAQSPAVKELVGQYLPNLEKALDNLGRVQLTLWMQEPELKGEIGETTFAGLEDNLRSTTKSMGDLVLKLSQGANAIKGQFEHEEA